MQPMTYTVAIDWLADLGGSTPTLIREMAEMGFTGISDDPKHLLEATRPALRDVVTAVAESGMAVTLHGGFELPVNEMATLAEELAPHLQNITFNQVSSWTSAGLLFSAGQMARYLHELESRTHGQRFCYAVEDFPATPFCLQFYRDDLAPLLDSERFGILVDVAHFHLAAHEHEYCKGVKPEEHLAQLPVRLVEVHLSDNDGREDQHLPLGEATLDFASVARGLKEIGFNGLTTIEIAPPAQDKEVTAAAKQQLADSLAFWRELVEDGKTHEAHSKPTAGDPDTRR